MTLMAKEEEAQNQSEGDDCPACTVAVGIGMYLNVCKLVDDKESCKVLYDKVTKEEISPDELFEIVKDKAKNNKEQLEILEYIDTLVKNAKEELEKEN